MKGGNERLRPASSDKDKKEKNNEKAARRAERKRRVQAYGLGAEGKKEGSWLTNYRSPTLISVSA